MERQRERSERRKEREGECHEKGVGFFIICDMRSVYRMDYDELGGCVN